MSSRIAVCLVASYAALCFAVSHGIAEPNMQEGLWEISGEMKLEGLPVPMPLVPVKFTQCLAKDDMVPQKREKDQECKTVSKKVEGNVVSWVMQCKGKNGESENAGRVTYKGNTFSGALHTVTTDARGKSSTTLQMSGKLIGDCK